MTDAVPAAGSPERSEEAEGGGGYGTLLLGAGVTVLFAFVPLAPLGGGALAGYLDRGRTGARAGALAGAAATVPIVLVLLFFLGMAAVIAGTVTGPRVLLALGAAAVGATGYTVGLSTLGGWGGAWLRDGLAGAPGPDDL